MQQYTSFPTTFSNPQSQPGTQSNLARRLVYLLFLALIVGLIAGSSYWLRQASQIGIHGGYPKPTVQILNFPTGTNRLNTALQFSAGGTGRDLTYNWGFGDGTSDSGPTVNHTYHANGQFTVTVTVTDGINQTSSYSDSVTILPPPPTASFTYSNSYGYYISFDASSSYSGDSTPLASYHWDFGDGNTDITQSPQDSHQYSSTGTFTVTLTVVDGSNQSNSTQQTISVSY